jgi:hypothetical protein
MKLFCFGRCRQKTSSLSSFIPSAADPSENAARDGSFFFFHFCLVPARALAWCYSRVNGRCRIRRASDFKIDSEQQRCLIFFEAKQIPPNE